MQPGQKVVVRADAVPDRELTGKIGDISTLARIDFSNWPPQRNFDLIVQLDQTDPRLRPGMNTSVRVAVDRVPDAVLIPVRAVFEKNGRSVAYVARAAGRVGRAHRKDCPPRAGAACRERRCEAGRTRGAEGSDSGGEMSVQAREERDEAPVSYDATNRKRLGWSLAGVLGAALAIVAFRVVPMQGVQTDGAVIPTARVVEGDVPVVVHATGELRPVRSVGLVAPAIGGPLQILHITGTGTPVKEGDVVVEFDLSEQEETARTGEVGARAGGPGDYQAARGHRRPAGAGAGDAAHGALRRPARRAGCARATSSSAPSRRRRMC